MVYHSCKGIKIVASLVPRNSKAVESAPDQTVTFPEQSLVRLLAVVVGGLVLGLWGLVGGLVICKMDLVW